MKEPLNPLQATREVMKLKNVGVGALAERLQIKRTSLSERFRHESISVRNLDEMLRLMDYKVLIVPRETKIPEEGFQVR
jgi:hypothetical protein